MLGYNSSFIRNSESLRITYKDTRFKCGAPQTTHSCCDALFTVLSERDYREIER